ncbi:sodium-translocating pyrophosphatase [Candidatus Marinamargulisbacteria bacterium SCGC AG-410-N11]|nr:sodium-translocating pyrophosphatase [Candidatus Marinamargulisbacteria bacterium SCGC AG-410-N11]
MLTSIPSIWYLAPVSAIIALTTAFILYQKLLSQDEGTPKMKEIAGYVKEGAMAYLFKQYKIMTIVFILIFIILTVLAFLGVQGPFVPLLFISGGFWSAICGYLGMKTATNASARTASACQSSLNNGLKVSFRAGSIMGLMVVGFGLLDLSIWFVILNIFYDLNLFGVSNSIANTLSMTWTPELLNNAQFEALKLREICNALLTYAMGASVMALFARVGGGIFTKAADVGADLVGKVEAGIPEDDPRNPATIADNVGDNVGDVAGMGADLYESYCGSILAATAIGSSLALTFTNIGINAIIAPMLIAGGGIIFSLIGIFLVKTKENATQKNLLTSLLIGTGITSVLIIIYIAILANLNIISWGNFGSIIIGLIAGFIIGQATEYYTSDTYKPTQLISEAAKGGTATGILCGISTGMKSTGIPVVVIALAIIGAFLSSGGSTHLSMGIYGIAFSAIGMLSTLGIQLATDAFGPIADNAGGNAEMAGLESIVRKRTDALDSLGNTTAATGKGFAIGSAALTALALITAYLDSVKLWITKLTVNAPLQLGDITFSTEKMKTITSLDLVNIFQINIINPKFICGIFIGAMMTFVFCALTISAVEKAAGDMVKEVRRQFKEIKGILDGTGKPDYKSCVSISTEGSLKAMIIPSMLAIFIPIIVGLLLNISGVLGLLIGTLTTGFSLAIFLNNAGGAWDNAKKYIEAGNCDGKGSETHKAAVIGDTIGDPFKDTSGPSLNILIKLMTIVSIVFVGVVIKYGVYL